MTRSTTDISELAARLRSTLGPLSRQLRQQSSDPLTATQVSVLGTIHHHGPLSLGEVAAREQLSPPMISKVVAALEELGFIERVQDRNDRRVWLVESSPPGQEWIERGRARRDAWLAEHLAALSPDELAALAAALPALERLTGDTP